MSENENDPKDGEKRDLTRIEDLAEYLHEEDKTLVGLDDSQIADIDTDPGSEIPEGLDAGIIEQALEYADPNTPVEGENFENAPNEESDFYEQDQIEPDLSFDPVGEGEETETLFSEPDSPDTFSEQDDELNDELNDSNLAATETFVQDDDSFSDHYASEPFEQSDEEESDLDFSESNFEPSELEDDDADEASSLEGSLNFESNEFSDPPETMDDSTLETSSFETDDETEEKTSFEDDGEEAGPKVSELVSETVPETATEAPLNFEANIEPFEPSNEPPKEKTLLTTVPLEPKQPEARYSEVSDLPLDLGQPGNPPFSILLENIKYQEDAELIIEELIDTQVLNEEDREASLEQIKKGQFLIARLSEYAAIMLVHKFRNLDLDINVGLSEEIFAPQNYESQDRGLLTKDSFLNSRFDHYEFDNSLSTEDVLVTSTTSVEGGKILNYLGVCSESTILGASEIDESIKTRLPDYQRGEVELREIFESNIQSSMSEPVGHLLNNPPESVVSSLQKPDFDEIYQDLVSKMKTKAIGLKGNALIGVQYQVVPLWGENYSTRYQITCSGSAVWVAKN